MFVELIWCFTGKYLCKSRAYLTNWDFDTFTSQLFYYAFQEFIMIFWKIYYDMKKALYIFSVIFFMISSRELKWLIDVQEVWTHFI